MADWIVHEHRGEVLQSRMTWDVCLSNINTDTLLADFSKDSMPSYTNFVMVATPHTYIMILTTTCVNYMYNNYMLYDVRCIRQSVKPCCVNCRLFTFYYRRGSSLTNKNVSKLFCSTHTFC